MHAAGKVFLKTYLKAIRDTFFPICGISQYVIFSSNRRGKFKLLSLYPHEENPEGDWSAYCNDFLSKQKIYSM